MAYGLRYQTQLFWVGPGAGPMESLLAPSLPGCGGGTGQLMELSVNPLVLPIITGTGTSGALASADITALTNAMAADIAAQMLLAPNLAKAGGWTSGQP